MSQYIKDMHVKCIERHNIERGYQDTKTLDASVPLMSMIPNDYLIGVPSLTITRKGEARPAYSINKRAMHEVNVKHHVMREYGDSSREFMQNMSLVVNGESQSPCSICVNGMEKASDWNFCVLGSSECLSSIYLSKKDTFVEKNKGVSVQPKDGIPIKSANTSPAFAVNTLCTYQIAKDIHPDHLSLVDDMSIAFNLCSVRNRVLHEWIFKRSKGVAYKCFGIPQFFPDGGLKKIRFIQEPDKPLKEIHRVINNYLGSLPVSNSVSAYVKGRNTAHAATQHLRPVHWIPKEGVGSSSDFVTGLSEDLRYKRVNRPRKSHEQESARGFEYYQPLVVIRLDIVNYFNSITETMVRNYFKSHVGYSHYVASLLAGLCTVKMTHPKFEDRTIKVLPQGSPISGSLSNQIGQWMFGNSIQMVLDSYSDDWVYTVYSDDIAISHPDLTIKDSEVIAMKERIIKIVQDTGLKVNAKKTRIERSSTGRIVFHGYTAYETVNVPKEVRESLKTMLYFVKKKGWASQCKSTGKKTASEVESYIRGRIQYVKQANEISANKLLVDLEECLVLHPLKKLEVEITKPKKVIGDMNE